MNKKSVRFILGGAALASILSLISCSTAGSFDKATPGTKVKLGCTDGKPIRYHYDPQSGDLTEKGPVLLGTDLTCGKAADLDEKGLLKLQRTGDWVSVYKGTTTPLYKVTYKLNKKEGIQAYFDLKTGKNTKNVTYKGGLKEGPEEGFFPSGANRYKGQNTNDKKTGMWEERGAEDSDCVTKGVYTADDKTGPWDECKESDDKKWYHSFHGNYASGLKDGPAEEFHATGSLSAKGSYRADLACKQNPPKEGVDACGKKTGRWTFYHPDGKTAEEGEYDPTTGKRSGTWTEYYASGEKMGMGPRSHTRDGLWTFYGKDGKIIGQYKFKGNDFMANYCIPYADGAKKEEGGCSSVLVKYEPKGDFVKIGEALMRSGEWKGYYPNGAKAWEGSFTLKFRSGHWKTYSESGGMAEEGDYNMGKKTGLWKENGTTVEYDNFGRPIKR